MDLIEMLNNYFETHEGIEEPGEKGKWLQPEMDEEGTKLMSVLWDKLFIGSSFNPETRSMIQRAGYRVWIGDGDSFGILVAVITKGNKNLSIG